MTAAQLERHKKLLEKRKEFDAKCHSEIPANDLPELLRQGLEAAFKKYGIYPTRVYVQPYIFGLMESKAFTWDDRQLVVVKVPRAFVFHEHSIETLPISFGFD